MEHTPALREQEVVRQRPVRGVSASNLDTLMSRYGVNDVVTVHAFRRDELMEFTVVLKADDAPQVTLAAEARPATAARLRGAWLGRV